MLLVKSNVSRSLNKAPLISSVLSLAWLPMTVAGQESESSPRTVGSSADLLTLGLSLAVVIGVIYALAYVLKRMNVSHTGNRQIKVVASAAMGTRERVCVIEVAGEQHLLGVTANQISHLATLSEHIDTSSSEVTVPFKDRLAQFMNGSAAQNKGSGQ
ncbi:hypothetical protein HMF8227_02093 [Saliniradius amylolyticus]|uniref:Flagellar protein n=1 Tax=Saliniradius amylolyticus TaxID=2183582 RepID=A0A2S2E4H9_9ALTE|nr:flagellar biosynthetic protein FliO [Saliniradius amylolyticus]AWL12554.1 hypothetical protein HMF8227_02093 [Saliniradius amylolyticus]